MPHLIRAGLHAKTACAVYMLMCVCVYLCAFAAFECVCVAVWVCVFVCVCVWVWVFDGTREYYVSVPPACISVVRALLPHILVV